MLQYAGYVIISTNTPAAEPKSSTFTIQKQQLDTIMGQFDPSAVLQTHLLEINLNVILPCFRFSSDRYLRGSLPKCISSYPRHS
jgi:hypothetical protein